MRHILFSLFFLLIPAALFAQNIEVREGNGQIQDKNLKGFLVCLELDARSVETGWSRFMKSLGKMENLERNTVRGGNLMLPSLATDAVDVYSRLTVSPRCIQIFFTAFRAGSETDLPEPQRENVRKMLYDFALDQQRQDLKKQMAEAERVVNLAVKAHDKRMDEGQTIRTRIARNHKERERLQRELEENARNLVKLKADSVRNQSETETALEEIKKVRAMAEEKKQKLGQLR